MSGEPATASEYGGSGGGASGLIVRPARLEDAAAIAEIYNQGIEERVATFETELRTVEQMTEWLREKEGRYPVVVAERDGRVVAWAGVGGYRPRACYDAIAEFSIYAHRAARGTGAAQAALEGLIQASEQAGFTKLVSRIFPENVRSRRLCQKVGFREVGTYLRHGKLDGQWRDAVIVERLLGAAREGLASEVPGA
jgi:phosphinothricin acetyltransferase